MSKSKIDNSQFIYNLNDLLANSERHSQYTNKLFNNLAFPPGLYIKKFNIKPPVYSCNNIECVDCIDDKLHTKLITLVNVADKVTSKKRSSKKRSPKKHNSKNKQKTKKNKT